MDATIRDPMDMLAEPFLGHAMPTSSANDTVYMPVQQKCLQSRRGNDNQRKPLSECKQFVYPVFSNRLPLQYEDLVTIAQEIDRVLGGQDVENNLWQSRFSKCAGLAVMGFMFLAVMTFSQAGCAGSPLQAIAILSFAMTFVSAFSLVCCSIVDMCRGAARNVQQDIFFNADAPLILQLRDKLVELSRRFNVTLDLLPSVQVVDKTEGAERRFMTGEEAWQRKVELGKQHGTYYFGAPQQFVTYCVALRAKQSPCAPPPVAPPLWRSLAPGTITIAEPGTMARFQVVTSDSAIEQCVAQLNSVTTPLYRKQVGMTILLGIFWLGGGAAFLSGAVLSALGIGCGELQASAADGNKLPPIFAINILVYLGIGAIFFAVSFKIASGINSTDMWAPLAAKISELNKNSRDVEIELGVETSMRRILIKQKAALRISPEPVLYFRRRGIDLEQ